MHVHSQNASSHVPKGPPPTETKQEISNHYQMHFPSLPFPGAPGAGQGCSGFNSLA